MWNLVKKAAATAVQVGVEYLANEAFINRLVAITDGEQVLAEFRAKSNELNDEEYTKLCRMIVSMTETATKNLEQLKTTTAPTSTDAIQQAENRVAALQVLCLIAAHVLEERQRRQIAQVVFVTPATSQGWNQGNQPGTTSAIQRKENNSHRSESTDKSNGTSKKPRSTASKLVIGAAAIGAIKLLDNAVKSAQQSATGDTPAITYPTTPTTMITATTAHTEGVIDNAHSTGQAWIELGTSTAYGTSYGPTEVTSAAQTRRISANWSKLLPNTTYHWRVRYVTNDGITIFGQDQAFTTARGI